MYLLINIRGCLIPFVRIIFGFEISFPCIAGKSVWYSSGKQADLERGSSIN